MEPSRASPKIIRSGLCRSAAFTSAFWSICIISFVLASLTSIRRTFGKSTILQAIDLLYADIIAKLMGTVRSKTARFNEDFISYGKSAAACTCYHRCTAQGC